MSAILIAATKDSYDTGKTGSFLCLKLTVSHLAKKLDHMAVYGVTHPFVLLRKILTGLSLGIACAINALTLVSLLGLQFWLSELFVSFLVQMIIADGILCIFLIAYSAENRLLVRLQRKNSLAIALIIVAFVGVVTTLVGAVKISNFAYTAPSQSSPTSGQSVKILSFNKLYEVNNYQKIQDKIDAEKPDVVALMEFTEDDHANRFIDQLKDEYPYSYVPECFDRNSDCRYNKNVLLSRFLTVQTSFTRILGAPLIQARLLVNNTLLQVMAFHASAPIYPSYYDTRNVQMVELAKLVRAYTIQSNTTPNQETDSVNGLVLVGDFNLSPWSPNYTQFIQDSGLKNGFQGKGINFTWSATPVPLITDSHIDHVFISPNVQIQDIQVQENIGSDHRVIITELKV